jgi:hypothetical protein
MAARETERALVVPLSERSAQRARLTPPDPKERRWRGRGVALAGLDLSSHPPSDLVALAAWVALVLVAHVLGAGLYAREPGSHLAFAPLVARARSAVPIGIVVPVLVGTTAVMSGPRLTRSPGWRTLLWLSFAAAAAWAVALAVTEGSHGLIGPVQLANDYARDLPAVTSAGRFLRSFVRGVNRVTFTQHVRGHPPGIVLTLWALEKVRLRGPWPEAFLFVAGGAAAVPAALVALRDAAGEGAARLAAPFLAFAPAAIWVATSGDALIAGVAAWAVALLILATSTSTRHRSDLLALSGGLVLGTTAMLSYGAPLVALVPVAVAVHRRRLRPLVVGTIAAVAVVVAFRAGGFWWWDGLHAAIRAYRAGVSRFRPQSYFWFGDLAAFAVVVGPATVIALGRLRDRQIWLLVGGAIVALAIADATGLSRGEAERIWLPFAPWVIVATASLGASRSRDRDRFARTVLALNVALAVAIQAFLHTTW